MRPAYSHIALRARQVIAALCISLSLSAQSFVADGELLSSYLANEMAVWKNYVDSSAVNAHLLAYEYGYCAALMETDKEAAKPYVQQFSRHVKALRSVLPAGHYEMYMSAVYVYELRLHLSFHPATSLSLAREAVRLAPDDPMTLSYCGTALFYAPKPFGDKKEALRLFLRAEQGFRAPEWYNCWWRPAAMMYIAQCYAKQKKTEEAILRCQNILREYPDYLFIREWMKSEWSDGAGQPSGVKAPML